MRVYVVALALLSAACFRSSSSQLLDGVDATVSAEPATVARIAATELKAHGYQVTSIAAGVVVTLPRPVTESLHQAGDTSAIVGRQWVLQVTAVTPHFSRGTHLRVAAFIVPPMKTTSRGGRVTEAQRGIPVTSRNVPLFAEVRAATKWITDAADRIR